jgi:hypothetical protein
VNWAQWVLIGVIALNTAAVILAIGKPRKPMEPLSAAAIAIVNTACIWLVVEAGS